jgi:hypothetical protein
MLKTQGLGSVEKIENVKKDVMASQITKEVESILLHVNWLNNGSISRGG